MATPRFVAKKVGDQYVIQRKDQAADRESMLFASVGGVLALCGFVRGGPLGWLARFVGGAMICRAVTGNNPFGRLLVTRKTNGFDPAGPSHQNDARPTQQRPDDAVDEAAMESFPASDPPARTSVAAVARR